MEAEETSPNSVRTEPVVEGENKLFETDKETLLSILPSNVWAYILEILEKTSSSELENVSNSSPFFRNVVLFKRVNFLFPQVFKLIGLELASQTNTETEGSDVIKSRIVCKQWNKGADQFIIDGTLEPDFFNTEPPQPNDHALINARYQYFGHLTPAKIPKFLTHFEDTHLPHSSRSPFIGKVVHIDLTGFTDRYQWATVADQVSTLFRKYGQHIKILNLGLSPCNPDITVQKQNHMWLLEWLGYCQNLTHLKVFEKFNPNGEVDLAFGERPDPERWTRTTHPRNLVVRAEDGREKHEDKLRRIRESFIEHVEYIDFDTPPQLPPPLGLLWPVEPPRPLRAGEPRPPPVPPIRPIGANPINPVPTLKDLECLKLCEVSHHIFNSLISANTHVTWLHVETLRWEKKMYIDYQELKFPNLKKLYIKLCSPEEVRKLRTIHPSWLSLTHLHFEYCSTETCCLLPEFIEWIEIFGVIYQQWGNTLTDMRLRLPVALKAEDKEKVVRDSEYFRLYLPKLKRLKIWLSERPRWRVAKMDFLDLLKKDLEQLIVE